MTLTNNNMPDLSEHICVCICTYKRLDLLAKLLAALEHQVIDDLFTYSVVVVDNDINKSAQDTVRKFQNLSTVRIEYHVEPEQNISLTRNRAVENAHGNYIAFIDDDEFPVSDWLLNLYKTMHLFKADGAIGPVRPYYHEDTPKWLIKSKLCVRSEHKTGTILNWSETRTGNAFFNKRIFDEDKTNRFDPEFGRSGGEDVEFFRKIIEAGKVFIWCNEAPVYETVPPARWVKEYYKQRSLRIGGLVGEKIRKRGSIAQCTYSLVKSMGWITTMCISLPFALLAGDHLYMRVITKIMYNTGLISGFMGRVIIRYRDE